MFLTNLSMIRGSELEVAVNRSTHHRPAVETWSSLFHPLLIRYQHKSVFHCPYKPLPPVFQYHHLLYRPSRNTYSCQKSKLEQERKAFSRARYTGRSHWQTFRVLIQSLDS